MPARVSAHEVRWCGLFVVERWQVHLLSRCLETEPDPRQMFLSPDSTERLRHDMTHYPIVSSVLIRDHFFMFCLCLERLRSPHLQT